MLSILNHSTKNLRINDTTQINCRNGIYFEICHNYEKYLNFIY